MNESPTRGAQLTTETHLLHRCQQKEKAHGKFDQPVGPLRREPKRAGVFEGGGQIARARGLSQFCF